MGLLDFYKCVLDNVFEGVCYVDLNGKIVYWNRGAEIITGYAATEVVGEKGCAHLPLHVNEHGVKTCGNSCHFTKVMRTGATYEELMYLQNHSNELIPTQIRVAPVYDEARQICGAVEIFCDLSKGKDDAIKIKTLAKMAYFDSLTELGNSQYIDSKLQVKLQEIKKHQGSFGVILIAINEFKELNEKYGHEIGDKALRIIARILSKNVETPDLVGRWHGTCFLVFLMNHKKSVLALQADKLTAALAQSGFYVDGKYLRFTVAVAAAMAKPEDTPQTLLKRLEEYLYSARPPGSILLEEED